MLLQILSHTPEWVFGLFALLVWLGARQLREGTVGLMRVSLMPLAMIGLSLYGVWSAFGNSPMALVGWAAAAAVATMATQAIALPAVTRFDAATRSFRMAGSAVPLVLMMGIFFTKYVVGVLMAMHPELTHQASFAVGISTLYGAFSGMFFGRALRLWKLALREVRELRGLRSPSAA
ncbi:hypothetical protein QTH91_18490 [Variovorax dokdonensis]|uniref:Transmembrane protein n=1 Tax=Variovorax dokdonensis TaxID=344883 RepID=A0ABT7NEW3_9BURK|nr:DUF6622 family protein [Variovorax dokdonensis]MDM0046486.1 hypothetical protein [Variovorax dokdonensis]